MLSKKEFIERFIEEMQDNIPEGMEIIEFDARKINFSGKGLSIKWKEANTGITVYPEQYYERYKNGSSIEEIADWTFYMAVNEDFKRVEALGYAMLEQITKYESIKYEIFPVLINAEQNMELLKEVPHETFLDMALIASYVKEDAQVKINNRLLELWGIDKEEVLAQAKFNAQIFKPSVAIPMEEIIKEAGYAPNEDEVQMYIVTNRNKIFGAYAMMDTGLLNELQAKMGDLYILPSSVHETIAVSIKDTSGNAKMLENLVREVNSGHVSPGERLSDHVYTFREGKVRIVENGKELTHEEYQKNQNKVKTGPSL